MMQGWPPETNPSKTGPQRIGNLIGSREEEVGAPRATVKMSLKVPVGLKPGQVELLHVHAILRFRHSRGCRWRGRCRHRGPARGGPAQDRGAAECDSEQRQLLEHR